MGVSAEPFERLRIALAPRYRLVREVGHGGMAAVYLAHDLKHDRRVAVKVLRPDLAATLGLDRFLREIRIAAVSAHPNILPLLDSGEADGFLYYVMPYLEGETLRDRLPSPTCEVGHDPHFTGAQALAAFATIPGSGGGATEPVPVEDAFGAGIADNHWREAELGTELMTSVIDPVSSPLSALTIAAFADMGYTVNAAAADPFTSLATSSGRRIALGRDVLRMPIRFVDRSGRVVR